MHTTVNRKERLVLLFAVGLLASLFGFAEFLGAPISGEVVQADSVEEPGAEFPPVEVLAKATKHTADPVSFSQPLTKLSASKREVVANLSFAALEPSPPFSVAIQVLDERGEPLKGARVYAISTTTEALESESSLLRPNGLPYRRNLWGRTDVNGEYLFEDLAAYRYRIGAWYSLKTYIASPTFELTEDTPGKRISIQLQPVPESCTISGTIKADINERTKAPRVNWIWFDDGELKHLAGTVVAIDDGWSFTVATNGGNDLGTLQATIIEYPSSGGPKKITGFAYARQDQVGPGTHNILLTCEEPRMVDLHLRSAIDVPPDGLKTSIEIPYGDTWLNASSPMAMTNSFQAIDADFRLRIPREQFRVVVSGPRTNTFRSEAFHGSEVGDRITLELDPMPIISGSVMVGDKALKNTTVGIKPVDPDESTNKLRNIRARSDEFGQFALRTELVGAYVLTLNNYRGWYAESEQLNLDGKNSISGIVIDLGATSQIHGHVKIAESDDPYSWFVVFRDEDNPFRFLSSQLADDCSYDSGLMRPGNWAVFVKQGTESRRGALADDDRRPEDYSYRPFDEQKTNITPRIVNLQPGNRLKLDLESGAEPKLQLSGSLLIRDEELVPKQEKQREYISCSWGGPPLQTIELYDAEDCHVSSSGLDQEKTFKLGAHEPGVYRLKMKWECDSGAKLSLDEAVNLRQATQELELLIDFGALRVVVEGPNRDDYLVCEYVSEFGMDSVYKSKLARKEETVLSRLKSLSSPETAAIEVNPRWFYSTVPCGNGTIKLVGSKGVVLHEQSVHVQPGQVLELTVP